MKYKIVLVEYEININRKIFSNFFSLFILLQAYMYNNETPIKLPIQKWTLPVYMLPLCIKNKTKELAIVTTISKTIKPILSFFS